MARWMFNLEGGPKRVNHAAVSIGDNIYSFGGYTATEVGPRNDFIDIHVLNTFTYRWELLPTFPSEICKKPRNSVFSNPATPSTSQSIQNQRRRTRSLSTSNSSHPLAQIRYANPPLDVDEEDWQQGQQITNNFVHSLNEDNALMEISNEDNAIDVDDDTYTVYQGHRYLNDNDQNLDDITDLDLSSVYSENSDDAEVFSDDEDMVEVDDEDRIFVQIDGDEDLELPNNFDKDRLEKLKQHPEIPFKLYGHTVVVYKGFFYLFGGRSDAYGCRKTLHQYNPVKNVWSIITTQGQQCPARDGHCAIVWGDYMYIFGGYEERELRFSQETYSFHFPTNTWKKVQTFGEPPNYRDFHAACAFDGKMFVFGGRSDESGQSHTNHDFYDDKLYFLDLKSMHWNVVNQKSNEQPCGRRSHTMWTYQGFIYIFGGYNSVLNVHFNDLWRFDPTVNTWTKQEVLGQGPSPRRRQCTIMIGSRLFLFGGTSPNPRKKSSTALEDLGDLYVLDFSPSLYSLCLQAILKLGMKQQIKEILPKILKFVLFFEIIYLIFSRELYYMDTPNQLSKNCFRLNKNMRG